MSNKKYLDNTGLNTVWNLIKTNFFDKNIGLDHPLYFRYRDNKNTDWLFKYNGIEIIYGGNTGNQNQEELYNIYISLQFEINENNYNVIDLSSGVYYATTSNTATKVSNELTLKQGDSVIYYNGQLKETIDVTPLKEITYSELKTLKDNNELIPGQQYRINDFVTTTNGDGGTNSAGNKFDIIVEAKSSNELSENAKACKTKFTNLYSVFNNYTLSNINTITAQYYVNNTVGPTNWAGVELNKIPSGIFNLSGLGFVPSTNTDIRTIKLAASGSYDLNLPAGKYWVLINYTSGNQKLNTVGAELVAQGSDTVISSDYHIGYTGNQYSNRLYCLEVPNDGIYNIKCYIIAHPNYDNGVVDATVTIQAGRFNNNINNIIPFINNNLSAWELKYSIENTSNIVNWVKSDGKGHIYYMKDEFGNECNYDFKNIRYGNYYTFDYEIDGKHIDGSSVYGNLCYNNVISMDVSGANGKLGFAKIYFKNTNNSAQCHSNRILHDNWQITFGNNCYDNYIGEKSQFITIGNNCHHNIIKCNSQYITLNNDCYSNTVDIGCESINFGERCNHNIVNCNSKNITLNNDCYSNTIGIGCETITFGERCRNNILNDGCLRNTFDSQCIANILDNDCNDNTFGLQCCDNKLGRLSNNNSFGAGCSNNIFGNNCIHNKFGANCSLNTLGNNCEYNEFLSNCSENMFSEYCSLNKFGSQCNKNIFELRCYSNEFGTNCYSNVFNINCNSNNFGADCFNNRFGIDCKNNLLTSNCHSNTFGNYCWDNKFGNGVFANTFGIDCSDIQIITAANSTTLLQFVRNFKFGNYCNKLKIYPKVSVTTADIAAGYLQNFEFGNNLGSTSQYTNIVLEGTAENLLGRKYITNIAKNFSGEIIQKCLMDIDKCFKTSYSNGKLTISSM